MRSMRAGTAATAAPADGNPYVGPRSLVEQDGLYGRNRDLAALLDVLIAQRIVLMYSPSGAGKTSLLQAGLVPKLRDEEGFHVRPIVRLSADVDREGPQPGNRYLAAASSCLNLDPPADEADRDPRWLAARLDATSPGDDSHSDELLIFDQFEELLNLDATDTEAKQLFVRQVGEALRDHKRWAIFAMREEYIAALDPYLRFIPTRLKATYRLDFLQEKGARSAIRAPAAARGVVFEDAAAKVLVDNLRRVQVRGATGEPTFEMGPYIEPVHLQVVCQRLWNRLDPRAQGISEIRASDIAECGSLDDELAEYYDEQIQAVAEATGTPQRAIRDWFDNKLLVGGFRNQVLDLPDTEDGASVVKQLGDAHLVRAERRRGALWFELAHDRLIEPIRRQNARWRETQLTLLQRQAEVWRDQDRPKGLLLSGDVLTTQERLVEGEHLELSTVDREFLDACRERRKEVDKVRRGRRNLRWVTVLQAATTAIAMVALVRLDASQSNLRDQQNKLLAEQERSTNRVLAFHVFSKLGERLDRSLLLDTEAVKGDSPESRSALLADLLRTPQLTTFLHSPNAAASVAFRPGGRLVAAGTDDGAIRLWDVEKPREAVSLSGHSQLVGGLDFSPDGKTLASGSDDTTIVLWDVERREQLAALRADHGKVTSVAFSRDGTTLASGHFDGRVLLWNVPERRVVATLEGHRNVVTSVAFGSDGTLASGSDDSTVLLWNVAAPAPVARLEAHARAVRTVAFSTDGTKLASGGNDGTVILWDPRSGQPLGKPLVGHRKFVRAVTFSPDGTTLASASEDQTVLLWDLASGGSRPLQGQTDFVTDVAFSGDGKVLASSSIDHSVVLWDLTGGVPLSTALAAHEPPVRAVTFSPDGRTMASGSLDTTVVLWDESRARVGTLQAHGDEVTSLAFSPDGRLLASGSLDGTVVLWDIVRRERTATLHVDGGGVTSVAFSPDGARLASGRRDGIVLVWELQGRTPVATLGGHREQVRSVAYAPNGTALVSGSDDGTIGVWDPRTHTRAATLEGQSGQVRSLAYSPGGGALASAHENGTVILWDPARPGERLRSPLAGQGGSLTGVAWDDDRTLASSSDDGTVVLWDVTWKTNGHPSLGQPLRAHRGAVVGVAFGGSPGRRILASAGNDGTVLVWDADPRSWAARACSVANRNLRDDEWDQFIGPGRRQRPTCP